MKIGILGGTGNMGGGLAVRLARRHEIVVGSRTLEKALGTTKRLGGFAKGFY